jgi:hypothetical protein
VRQITQPVEEPAAEVDGVDLRLVGRVRGRQPDHQGAEQGALAGPWRPDHREVAGAPRQVHDQRPLLLLEGPVDHADGHLEPAPLGRPEQRPEVDGRGQRRKPDLVGGPSGAAQPVGQGLQVGGDEGGGEPDGSAASTFRRALPGAGGRW